MTAQRNLELNTKWLNETSDPATWTWRQALSPAEAAIISRWDRQLGHLKRGVRPWQKS